MSLLADFQVIRFSILFEKKGGGWSFRMQFISNFSSITSDQFLVRFYSIYEFNLWDMIRLIGWLVQCLFGWVQFSFRRYPSAYCFTDDLEWNWDGVSFPFSDFQFLLHLILALGCLPIRLFSLLFFFIKFFVLLLRSPFWCWSLCCFDDILRSVGSDADSHQLWMDSGVLQIQWWRWEEWKPPGDRRDIARGRGMDGDLIALPLLSGDADANPKFGAGNEAKYPTHRLLFQMIDCRHHDNLKWLCSIKAIALMDSRRV